MGHWNKLRYGKSVKKSLLPTHEGEDMITISIMPHKEKPEPSEKFTEIIVVPEHITKLHPLVTQTRKRFTDGDKYNAGIIVECLDIRVSPKQLSRAYRIMDTIIKTLEQHGAKVGTTYASIDGEKVHFSLRESQTIVKKEPDPKSYFSNTQELVPNGKFVLAISDYLWGCRSKWTESEQGKLEENLISFINGLWVAAAQLKKKRLEREEEAKQYEEEQKECERKLQAVEEEKRRIQILERQVELWKKSRELRTFIRAVIRNKGAYTPDSERGRWIAWATAYADKLDPLKPVLQDLAVKNP